MKKYYFGIQRFVPNDAGKLTPAMFWGKNGHNSVEECLKANCEYIAKHLGEKFTIGYFTEEELSK